MKKIPKIFELPYFSQHLTSIPEGILPGQSAENLGP